MSLKHISKDVAWGKKATPIYMADTAQHYIHQAS